MKHFGDITKLSGYDLPVVDVITGGSPCQDLSVAGKRAGLAGERSGLFMEQMRIVKEMRERERATGRTGWMVRPRYMVWENVPGAFSSGNPKGADFAAVIEEIIKVAEPGAAVCVCVPNGGWTKSGCYYAEDGSWSVAWRVHDAQFWGVPQRRKRIALVADFGGLSAPEILFERKGLSGDSEPGGAQGEETAGAAGGGVASTITATYGTKWNGNAGAYSGGNFVIESGAVSEERGHQPLITAYGIDQQGGKSGANYANDVCPPILSDSHGTPHAVAYGISSAQNQRNEVHGVCDTISFQERGGKPGGGKESVFQIGCDVYNQEITGEVAASLTAASGGTNTSGPKVFCLQGNGIDRADTAGCNGRGWTEDVSYTQNTIDRPAVAFSQNQRNEVRDLHDVAGALAAEPGMKQQTFVYDARCNGDGKTVCTITGDPQNRVTDYTALCVGNGVLPFDTTQITSQQNGCNPHYGDPCHPLAAGAHPPAVAIGNGQLNQMSMAEQANTLDTMHDQQAVMVSAIVRRLTPLECERLQGYPDGWTDIGEWVDSKGKKHKDADSPRYKALGNSIALPFWQWMAKRISAQYERTPTMASLFDGIGGFPLVFQRCGAVPVWASEIEEFPIAVTKVRFPDESV